MGNKTFNLHSEARLKDVWWSRELTDLEINGYEDAWGFQWGKRISPKLKEAKKQMKNINRQIIECSERLYQANVSSRRSRSKRVIDIRIAQEHNLIG
jgi:hypothetical protein